MKNSEKQLGKIKYISIRLLALSHLYGFTTANYLYTHADTGVFTIIDS